MIIDAHAHVWRLRPEVYDWPNSSVPVLNRDLTIEDLEPRLDDHGIDGVVLVQAADHGADTANMLAEADRHDRVMGVVGWIDLTAEAEEVAAQLAHLRRDARIVGIRTLMHVQPDPHWILQSRQDAALGVLEQEGMTFDAVTSSFAALDDVRIVCERHPGLPIVLDHLGKPPIGRGGRELKEWEILLREIAANPAVTAKLSGLYSATDDLSAWSPAGVAAVVDVALDAFGPSRLMYGGDWPVALLAGGYARSWDAITSATAHLSDDEREMVFGATAARVYRLDAVA